MESGSLEHKLKERTVCTEMKKGLRVGIIVINASETWVWNESQRSRKQAIEMSYL